MSKRILAAVLWYLTGWCVGSFVAYGLGVSELLGPILGIAFAAVIAGDPMDRIWRPAREAEHARTVAKSRLSEVASSR